MSHTPGPWKAIDLAVWHAGSVVAQCHWISGQITDTEAEANARLIAAAPDMLKALEMILQRASEREVALTAAAAIQRATGAVLGRE